MKFLATVIALASLSVFAQTETATKEIKAAATATNDGIVPQTKEVKAAEKAEKKATKKMKKAEKKAETTTTEATTNAANTTAPATTTTK